MSKYRSDGLLKPLVVRTEEDVGLLSGYIQSLGNELTSTLGVHSFAVSKQIREASKGVKGLELRLNSSVRTRAAPLCTP